MNYHELTQKFSQGISWNALLYGVNKFSYLLLSFLLYTRLTPQDFSSWANLLGMVYLFLLWADMGLRRSLPRFLPLFAQSNKEFRSFLWFVFTRQTSVLIVGALLFCWYMPHLCTLLCMGQARQMLHLGIFLFMSEGILTLMNLIFHAHFWQKQFNLISTSVITVEMIANITLIALIPPDMFLVRSLIVTKICGTCITIIICLALLKKLSTSLIAQPEKGASFQMHKKQFMMHSALMWSSITTKSLSERNFMLPLFTYFLGPELANIYKVANDGALFFQRAIHKTIGTTDTSLLAHTADEPENITRAFNHLLKKVLTLCIPLTIIFLCLIPYADQMVGKHPLAIQLFIMITIGYLMESILAPHERLLEVKANYEKILTAYLPYLTTMALIIFSPLVPSIGLAPSIVIIMSIRLTSVGLATYFARKEYGLTWRTNARRVHPAQTSQPDDYGGVSTSDKSSEQHNRL